MTTTSLHYLDVILTEQGAKHQFYFDAGDAIDILNGVHIFYESKAGNEFQTYQFNNEVRVVQALAFGGFLGKKIRLLPPHQVELAEKVRNGLADPLPDQNYLEMFWRRDLNYYTTFHDIVSDTSKRLAKAQIEEWVKHKGKDLFKAIFFSYKITWQERLVEVFNQEIFQLKDYTIDDIEVSPYQDLFNELLDCFNKNEKRAARSENNYRDVLSLIYLARKVKQYNKDKTRPVPVYFDSQHFSSLIPNYLLKEFFSFEIGHHRHSVSAQYSYALRGVNYFKLYSLLTYNKHFPNEDKKYENFISKQHVIADIKKTLDEIQYTERVLGSRSKLEQERQNLEEKVSNYIDYDFFNTVLLKFIVEDDTIIRKVFADINIPPVKEEVILLLKQQIELLLAHLNKEINAITNWSASTFNEVDKRVEILRTITDKIFKKGKDFDVFNDYSLFRFFIPEEFKADIKLLFSSDGVLSKDHKTYKGALVSIWNLLFRSSSHQNDKSESLREGDLFKLFSSLWILNLHETVEQIKTNSQHLHHSLLMLKGACLDRAINEAKRDNRSTETFFFQYREIIRILESRLDDSMPGKKDSHQCGEIRIVLAYLYFHLWVQKGNELLLERVYTFPVSETADGENLTAINYAKEAFLFFDQCTAKENKHRIYALNIYAYYVIDSGSDEEYEKVTSLINELISLKARTNGWHFRYDDTIARNFHRRSLKVSAKESKLNLANAAIKILEESLTFLEDLDGRDIKEVESYKLRLQNYIAEIESK